MQQRKNNNPESEHQQTSNSRKSGYVNSGAETEADTTSHASIKRNRRRQRLVIHKTYRESPTKSEPRWCGHFDKTACERRRQDWFDSWGSFFPSTVVPWEAGEGSCLPTRGNVVGPSPLCGSIPTCPRDQFGLLFCSSSFHDLIFSNVPCFRLIKPPLYLPSLQY